MKHADWLIVISKYEQLTIVGSDESQVATNNSFIIRAISADYL